MIFVTVGTHEQSFDRLVKCVDEIKKRNVIADEIIIQTGYSTYEPKFCRWRKMFTYKEMIENVEAARIVITHGGPSSFFMPLQMGKIPIVVPRRLDFREHVNNHQVYFCHEVCKRKKNIFVIDEISDLEDAILNYDTMVNQMNGQMISNNKKFNQELEKMILDIL